jgi:hypothetical protein
LSLSIPAVVFMLARILYLVCWDLSRYRKFSTLLEQEEIQTGGK